MSGRKPRQSLKALIEEHTKLHKFTGRLMTANYMETAMKEAYKLGRKRGNSLSIKRIDSILKRYL